MLHSVKFWLSIKNDITFSICNILKFSEEFKNLWNFGKYFLEVNFKIFIITISYNTINIIIINFFIITI